MKNKQWLHMGLCGMLLWATSCEKMTVAGDGEAQESPANVVLRVGAFEQVPFSATRASDPAEVSTRLNFAVYNSEGKRVQQINQKQGDEDFGQARLLLTEGHYFLVVLAHGSTSNPTMTNPVKINFKNGSNFTDTFLYGDSLIVGDAAIDKTLTLRRIVAKVRFVFEDTPPTAATRIRFYYEGGSGTFDAASGWGNVASKQVQWYDLDRSATQYEIYTIPHADKHYLKVTVNAYQPTDAGEIALTEKTIDSIPITRNKITVCRGNLFDTASASAQTGTFRITVEDDWEEGETLMF